MSTLIRSGLKAAFLLIVVCSGSVTFAADRAKKYSQIIYLLDVSEFSSTDVDPYIWFSDDLFDFNKADLKKGSIESARSGSGIVRNIFLTHDSKDQSVRVFSKDSDIYTNEEGERVEINLGFEEIRYCVEAEKPKGFCSESDVYAYWNIDCKLIESEKGRELCELDRLKGLECLDEIKTALKKKVSFEKCLE